MMAVLGDDKRTIEELRADNAIYSDHKTIDELMSDCAKWKNKYENLVIVVETYLKDSKKNEENLAMWLDKKMQS